MHLGVPHVSTDTARRIELPRVLLTGATSCVGRSLLPELNQRGFDVRCGTRDPTSRAATDPGKAWVAADFERPETLDRALEGVRIAFYLVHARGIDPEKVEEVERRAAETFIAAAARARVARIVYLGAVKPRGEPSHHLRARLRTGEILRSGPVPTLELRTGMIIGAARDQWGMVRDLSVRHPIMLLPRWLEHRSQPVALEDVVFALAESTALPVDGPRVLGLPGPDTLAGFEILRRIAEANGTRPFQIRVPFESPGLSSRWIRLITRASTRYAHELVEDLTSDLVNDDESFWPLTPHHSRIPFDEAVRRALAREEPGLPIRARVLESLVRRISPSP